MKQSIVTVFISASVLFAQASGPAPVPPKSLPPAPSPQEVLAGRPAGAAPTPSVPDDKVVLTVGTDKVTAKDFNSYLEALPEQLRAQARGPMKRQMAEQIVRVKLLSQEAKKAGLDKEPATQARINFQVENLLAGAQYNELMKSAKVDDASAKKYFDEHKNEWEEVSARHILIKFKGSPVPSREGKPELTEEQALAKAQEIRKKLAAGEDFAALAKTESDDAGSGANGGDLGTFKRNSMVPEFEKTAFSLPVGQVSEPIKTQFGYHLIKVDKHDTPAIDTLRGQIDERVKPEVAKQAVEEMRNKANISMDEAFFGPPPAAPVIGGAAPSGAPAPSAPPAPKPAK